MNRLLITCALLGSLLLSACASTTGSSAYQTEPQKRIAAVLAKYPRQEINLLYVAAPNSFISTRLIIASLNAGINSNDVDAIIAALSIKNGGLLAIAGDNDSLTAATLERALIAGGKKLSGSKVVYVGGQEDKNTLTSAAETAGVTCEFVAYP